MLIVVVGLLVRDGKFLIQQRPIYSKRGGLWEFPGGKVDPGETMRDALKREWMEELGVDVEVGHLITEAVISFPEIAYPVLLPLFHIYTDEKPGAKYADCILWATLNEALSLPGVPTMAVYASVLKGLYDH